MVTIKEIAERSGVSIATVSKIINGKDKHISEETRRRVKDVLRDTGYVSNAIARGLKIRKTFTLGYVLPDITNPFFAGLARGIEDLARERDYSVIMCNTDNDPEIEERSIKLFKSHKVDGILCSNIVSSNIGERGVQYYRDLLGDIPTVFLDHVGLDSDVTRFGYVQVDSLNAIYKGTKALLDAGCKRVACITASQMESSMRINGYYAALEEAGIARDNRIVYVNDFSLETGTVGIRKIMENDPTIDGLMCGNDMIAVGAIGYLNKIGVQIPEQIKIVGIDNIPISEHVTPKLTTVAQPIYEMGWEAANMLVNYIEDGIPLFTKTFEAHLIERETLKLQNVN